MRQVYYIKLVDDYYHLYRTKECAVFHTFLLNRFCRSDFERFTGIVLRQMEIKRVYINVTTQPVKRKEGKRTRSRA